MKFKKKNAFGCEMGYIKSIASMLLIKLSSFVVGHIKIVDDTLGFEIFTM